MCEPEGLDENVGDGMVDAMVCIDGEDVFGFILGSMVINLRKNNTNYALKFCGGGWNAVKSGFSVCLFQNHYSLSMIMVVMYAHVWCKMRAYCCCICIVGFAVCI